METIHTSGCVLLLASFYCLASASPIIPSDGQIELIEERSHKKNVMFDEHANIQLNNGIPMANERGAPWGVLLPYQKKRAGYGTSTLGQALFLCTPRVEDCRRGASFSFYRCDMLGSPTCLCKCPDVTSHEKPTLNTPFFVVRSHAEG